MTAIIDQDACYALEHATRQTSGNRTRAARLLGFGNSTTLTTYLIGSGLRTGLLIYPRGEDEAGDRTIDFSIEGHARRILFKSIDISGPAESILSQVRDLAGTIRRIASDPSGDLASDL